MGKYKEILSVSNKVNTYLTLRVRNVPPSCMDAGRSTLAECFFTSCGNTDSSAYPNQVFVESMQQLSAQHLACSNPTVFLYVVILYSVYVCVGGAGGRGAGGQCLGMVGAILDPLSLCVPNSGAQMRNCPKKACRIPGRKDRAGRPQPGC